MRKKNLAPPLALLLLLAIPAATLLLAGCGKTESAAAHAAKKWTCPMHPEIVKDGPGDCPICGMKLVPVEADAPGTPAPGTTAPTAAGPEGHAPITIDAQKQQLMGLTTALVKMAPFETSIRTTSRVAYDERRVHHVHTRYDAFVEHVTADFTGKYVKKGEVLAHLYSPDLYATQQEYLLALKASRSLSGSSLSSVAQGSRELLEATRQRLILWEVSPADIEALEKRGEPTRSMPVYAPISGFVTGRTAFHGMKVSPADTLFDIVDLTSVWVIADVYEYELPRLSLGERGTMTLSYWPGRSWTGTVTYIYPSLDEKTRTVKVRLEFANPKEELKPEMFADVTIHGPTRTALVVPDDAILDSGTRKVVFVAEGGGKLSPREVVVGDHAGGQYEVTKGLSEGETVARGASFLVDSESRLKAALSAMTATAKPSEGEATPAARKH
jgi:Cu(I)/Ag(I) efflux system membrane fusion protein